MAVHVSSENFDEDPSALYRGRPPRVARVRAIAPTARLLAPTQSSLVRARAKALTRQEKEKEERRQDERKRRRLTKVAKANGRLTIPQSPKFHPHPRARPSFRNAQLTMTSRELEEIAAIRQRVASMRNKTRRYHEQTTRAFPSVPRTKDNAKFTVVRSPSCMLNDRGGFGLTHIRVCNDAGFAGQRRTRRAGCAPRQADGTRGLRLCH